MDISRRGVLGVIGTGLGSVGLAGATQMNNQTNTPSGDQNEQGDGDGETDDDKNEQEDNEDENENENEQGDNENENDDKNEQGDNENENEDGNDHAEKNEGADNGNVGTVDLSQQEAEKVATQKVGGGTVQRVELEIEDAPKYSGTPVYNVVVKTNSGAIKEVTLNANSGDVLFVADGA